MLCCNLQVPEELSMPKRKVQQARHEVSDFASLYGGSYF